MSNSASILSPEARRTLFDQFLRCLDREENLIHYRLSWGLQWNIACFAAIFALPTAGLTSNLRAGIYIVIAFFAAAASLLSLIGILAAQKQTAYLIDNLNHRLGVKNDDWDESVVEFIRPYGDRSGPHRTARMVSTFLPLLFIALWVLVFFYSYTDLVRYGKL